MTFPLTLGLACDDAGEFGDPPAGVDPDEQPTLRCTPDWECVGGGQTPKSGGYDLNNVPYRTGHYGEINYKYHPAGGASVLHFNGGTCLQGGQPRDIVSWDVVSATGEIRVLLRVPSGNGYADVWQVGDSVTDQECTWNFAVYDYTDQSWSERNMRFSDRQLQTVNGKFANTYVMWTDVEPDVDGALHSDGFYTACFDDGDHRVVAIGETSKVARQAVATFASSANDAVFECVRGSPIGEAFERMGLHLSDMNDANELMAVQNMMQGAGDRGYPSASLDEHIAPVCDAGEYTMPPTERYELEACWDESGANCRGEDFRIENDLFPASFTTKPACTPALMAAAFCCSYVER